MGANAQTPQLEVRQNLNTSLISGPRSFTDPNKVDTIMLPLDYAGDFTLEVKGTVKEADGRGLDIEARKKDGTGFRTSVSPTKLYWSNPITDISSMTFSTTSEQTLRYAVKGSNVHIYQNGIYISTRPLEFINNITDNQEVAPEIEIYGDNLVAGWAGKTGSNSGMPTAYGWESANTNVPWNSANGSGGVRYIDVNSSSSTVHTLNSTGTPYTGRLLSVRWDNSAYESAVFVYPMTLSAYTPYNFSFLYELWSNANSGTMTVKVSKDKEGKEIIASKSFYSSVRNRLYDENVSFSSEEAGEYYLLFSGTYAMYAIADLDVRESNIPSHIIIGKNYSSGAADMHVSEVKYDKSGAYAPEAGSATVFDVVIEDEIIEMESVINKNIIMKGKSELHLTSESPLINSTVDMHSENCWLYISNIKPSDVTSAAWIKNITVEGKNVTNKTNSRISPYLHGTVINAYGNRNANAAITVFTEENFGGQSRTFSVNTYHNSLGAFDNKVRSFKIKKGYSATLANNSNGTGFSRHFIAEEEDLEVASMPEGLEFVSFIRAFYWNWVTKKGWAGGGYLDMTNSTWFYDWDAGGNTESTDFEYAPMRHNANWQSYSVINSRENASHVLGFNEPERSDQANISVHTAINQWPELFKSGLRIGSPAPASAWIGWLDQFMRCCDSLNYRVDVAAVHCYEGGKGGNPSWWASRHQEFYNNYGHKRPVWITEFNNGANWTSEWWPDDLDAQYAKQEKELKAIMEALDNCEYVERYAFYNWVQDKRGVVVNNVLTPAGHMFAAHKSSRAFTRSKEYIHTWKIAPPWIRSAAQSKDYKTFDMTWYDHNGETGLYYVIERKVAGETRFTPIDTLYAEKDYAYGATINYSTPIPSASAEYKIKARSYKNKNSEYSRVKTLTLDTEISAPENLTAEAIGASMIELNWDAVSGANSYTLKRANSADGNYTTVKSGSLDTSYTDKSLKENTTYYYKISASNNRGETEYSETVAVTTQELALPENITGISIAAGDAKVVISWDMMYDTNFRIYRSDTPDGEFVIYASNITDDSYENNLLVNGQTYYYKIEAYNALGNYMHPEVFKATPQKNHHAYFSFNEKTGTMAHDNWGGFHGTLNNAHWSETGKHNGELSLTAEEKGFVSIADGIVSGLDNFTISAWVNYSSLKSGSELFNFSKSSSVYMSFSPNTDRNIIYTISTGSATYTAQTEYDFPENEWVYLTLTQSGSTFKVYINGDQILNDTRATVKPSDLGVTTTNYIGRSLSSSASYSDSKIDELRIYNRALEDGEIMALMNETIYSITLNVRTGRVNAGETYQLFASVFPDNALNGDVIWTSEDPVTAEVDENGLVFAKNEGRTNISAATVSGDLTSSCRITVVGSISETGVEEYDADIDIEIFIRNNIVYVNTPNKETVEIYSVTGQSIMVKEKQEGPDMITLPSTGKQVLIIKGNSGWVKKLIKQ